VIPVANNPSVWSNTTTPPEYPRLTGSIDCDVLVIGGGMAGVLTANELQAQGVDVVLVEGRRLGSGATQNTTAVVTAQHDTRYTTLIKMFGERTAAGYLEANLQAIEAIRQLAQEIPCDFEDKPSAVVTTGDTQPLRDEWEAVQRLGFGAEWIEESPLPMAVKGGVRFPGMGQMHPLKLLYGAASRLNVYENTFVRKIRGTVAYTREGEIRAKRIVAATHFPLINRVGLYFLKLYQTRSYVLAVEGAPALDASYVEDESGLYFRDYQGLLLVGGGDARTGRTNGYCDVQNFITANYPSAAEKYRFAAQDCMSLDGVPYIGAYSPLTPNFYVASGFGEWGMTSSMVAARLLADELLGRKNKFAAVFTPRRTILRKQLLVNVGEVLATMVTPTLKRCPHMGCALTPNHAEGSWDCRCHGSRFDAAGTLIDNPAMRDAQVRPRVKYKKRRLN
jgi:glycine/D-amino acid oxidase-like deaminating enzyme